MGRAVGWGRTPRFVQMRQAETQGCGDGVGDFGFLIFDCGQDTATGELPGRILRSELAWELPILNCVVSVLHRAGR
jgi:hypothetical protein